MDVRFLPNPHYDPALRPLTGLDAPVRDFVLGKPETAAFLNRWLPLLEDVVPGYVHGGQAPPRRSRSAAPAACTARSRSPR